MRSKEDIERLVESARSWVGTPFCPRSAIRGSGASCSGFVAECYFGAWWLPRFDVPTGPAGHARWSGDSIMEKWIDGCGHFRVVDYIEPGDLLGFQLGRCIHHLAIAMPNDEGVHCIEGHGVIWVSSFPTQWTKRLRKIWRPKP